MSQNASKQPISGLKSIKRDFSSNVASSGPGDGAQTVRKAPPLTKKTGASSEQRLKLIREALEGMSSTGDKSAPTGQLVNSGLKRPNATEAGPAPKRRQLPWDPLSEGTRYTSISSNNGGSGRALTSSNTNGASGQAITVSSSSSSSGKPAPVFLSQEQTHILKLVENGESIFYTGSAGEQLIMSTPGRSVLIICAP